LLSAAFLEEKGAVVRFIIIVRDISEQKQNIEKIHKLNEKLESRVAERTEALSDMQMALLNLVDDLNESSREISSANKYLEEVNRELAAFSYSVSHDLRAPLRAIDGFSNALLEDYSDRLDAEGNPRLLEINTLPGLTPGFSDLCVIANATGLRYEDLILEILHLGASRFGMLKPKPVMEISPMRLQHRSPALAPLALR